MSATIATVPVTIEPKRSALIAARLKDDTYTVNIPATDAGLGRDAFATRWQSVVSLALKADATGEKDAKGNITKYDADQFVTAEQLAAIIDGSLPKVVSLLIGERAESVKLTQAEKLARAAAAKETEIREAQSAQFRTMFNDAGTKAGKMMVVTMATQFGYADVAAELSATL